MFGGLVQKHLSHADKVTFIIRLAEEQKILLASYAPHRIGTVMCG